MTRQPLPPRVSRAGEAPPLRALPWLHWSEHGWAHGPIAFRRVDVVTATSMKVDGVWLPHALAKGAPTQGEWLRFERKGDAVSVHVELRATLDGEERFNELLRRLAGGWLPVS